MNNNYENNVTEIRKCHSCGREFPENLGYNAFHMITYKEYWFDSVECLHSWAVTRIVTLAITLILGIVAMVCMIGEMGATGAVFITLPYMIRYAALKFSDLFDGGNGGEFLTIMLVLLSTITVVYPLYKFIRELVEYISLAKYQGNPEVEQYKEYLNNPENAYYNQYPTYQQ
ncbi:MAG: hypothetical protein II702_08685 [Clostridia bacterium]|nr:hypothetical protein [Clostridia bacterium]